MPTSWFTPIDNYCERIGPDFWAEPLNALSNGAFIGAAAYAFVLWRRAGAKDRAALWLIAITAAVGIGSFLFHTFANRWSLLADVLPIAVFIYGYFLLAMRRHVRFRPVSSILATGLFVLFNTVFTSLWVGLFPGMTFNGSVGYIPAILALLAVGIACLWANALAAGRALLLSAGLFAVSLFFRSIDNAICPGVPVGTHFIWHALNALVLLILMQAALAYSPMDRAKPR
jgi:Ceramidase